MLFLATDNGNEELRSMSVPHIRDVNPNSPGFRAALDKACEILSGKKQSVYSHHLHYEMRDGEIVFVEPVSPGELALYPLPEREAAKKGLPSVWAFERDGTAVALRYAHSDLHERSDIDVASEQFQLAEIGRAFAARGLHKILELTIDPHLFPAGSGQVACEVTDTQKRCQRVTLIPQPDAIRNGNWARAACWSFNDGQPIVTGICIDGGTTTDDH
jgi:hypothetical protein